MAESGRTEDQRRALREALRHQLADMAALQAAAEGERREQEELLARIKAMESKVCAFRLNRLVGPRRLVMQCLTSSSMGPPMLSVGPCLVTAG